MVTDTPPARDPKIEQHMQLSFEQGRLRHDVDVVRAYGEAHPEAWVGLRYENEPSVRIVALFTGDHIQLHEEALRVLVEHPDRLELRSAPFPLTHLEAINAEIHTLATTSEVGSFKQWGVHQGVVQVALKASKVSLAAELVGRFGEAVDLSVGFFHFPDMSPMHPRVQGQDELPLLPADLANVSIPDRLTVESGDDVMGVLVVRNTSPRDIVIETNGRVTARIVDPNSGECVGGFLGAQNVPLISFTAPPDGSVDVPLLIGTASFVERLGYALPPGDWLVDTALGIKDRGGFRTQLLPISVTP